MSTKDGKATPKAKAKPKEKAKPKIKRIACDARIIYKTMGLHDENFSIVNCGFLKNKRIFEFTCYKKTMTKEHIIKMFAYLQNTLPEILTEYKIISLEMDENTTDFTPKRKKKKAGKFHKLFMKQINSLNTSLRLEKVLIPISTFRNKIFARMKAKRQEYIEIIEDYENCEDWYMGSNTKKKDTLNDLPKTVMDSPLNEEWFDIFKPEFEENYWKQLEKTIEEENNYCKNKRKALRGDGSIEQIWISPPRPLLFNAFNQCSFEDCKVVIIGQDPYPTPGDAVGMSFSARRNSKNKYGHPNVPKSLANIYKELKRDPEIFFRTVENGYDFDHPDLVNWARQGVLLLNTALTVRTENSGSHMKIWKNFTSYIVDYINTNKTHPVIFMLWGRDAEKMSPLITVKMHHKLTCKHPVGMGTKKNDPDAFYNSGQFSKCNEILRKNKLEPIDWNIC